MKILLINSNKHKIPWAAMPFGLCCVAAAVEKAGHHVNVLDLCFSGNCSRDIKKAVENLQPDLTGISIRNIDNVAVHSPFFFPEQIKKEITDPLKEIFPGPIVIGGTAVGINGPELLEYFDLEYAIRGDGELAMVEFIDRLRKKAPMRGLNGLIQRKENKIIEDNPPLRTTDLDSLPWAKHYRFIDLKPYLKTGAPIQVQTKRGCSYACTYCSYNIIEGKEFRLRDPQAVADEIETIFKETGVNHFEFTDSIFNFPLDHSKAVLRAIIAKKLNLKLQTMGLSVGSIDEEYVDLLKKAGFVDAQLGMESGCDAVLKTLGKDFNKADILRVARLFHEKEFPVIWYVMTGAPGENEESLKETCEVVKKVTAKWDMVVMGNGIRLYKNSPLSKQALRKKPGIGKDNFLHPVFFEPEAMSLKSIRAFNKKIYKGIPNIQFFEDYQEIPYSFIKLQALLMKLLTPGKPVWQAFVFMQTFKKKLTPGFLR